MRNDPLHNKSYSFALEIIQVARTLAKQHRDYVLSRQTLRSGTAIGALIREAEFAESKRDFTSKMSIALKEANETRYWLDLLHDSRLLNTANHESLRAVCTELIKMLVTTVKSSKLS